MKRILALTKRSLTETVKSPLAPVLCILPPIVMLVLMELLFSGVGGTDVFKVESFVPGIAAFGYTFTTLYIALNVSGDSGEQFLVRILVSPVKPIEYLSAVLLSALPDYSFRCFIIFRLCYFILHAGCLSACLQTPKRPPDLYARLS